MKGFFDYRLKQRVVSRFNVLLDRYTIYHPTDTEARLELKQLVLDAADKATLDRSPVTVKFNNAIFEIYPDADKEEINRFNPNRW